MLGVPRECFPGPRCDSRRACPGGQTATEPVSHVTVVHDDDDVPRDEPVNKVSVCCPFTQLSSLTYVDVIVKSDQNESGSALEALSNTGAQISVLDV